MGKIWMPGGGGGGASSDDCTLTRAAVPSGMKAVTADSDDEAMEGTLNPDTTLADSQALSGQTFLKWNPQTKLFEKHTGNMANKGAWNSRLGINGKIMIPAGYHNGSGYVDQALTTKGAATYTPGRSNQVIGASQWLSGAQTILGDPNLQPGNIREGVTIFGTRGNVQEYKSPASISMNGSMVHGTGGTPYYKVTSEGYGEINIYANGQWWGIARLNNNLPLNLTGWNYINAQLYSHLQYYMIATEVYFGVSQNSNLTSLDFTVSHKYVHDRLATGQNTMSSYVKLNVTNLTGNYYLYLAFRITKTVSGTDKKPYVQVRGATLSTQ